MAGDPHRLRRALRSPAGYPRHHGRGSVPVSAAVYGGARAGAGVPGLSGLPGAADRDRPGV